MILFERCVVGQPVSMGRPRFARMGRFVHAFTPPKTREYQRQMVDKLRATKARRDKWPLVGALRLTVVFGLAKPKSSKNDKPLVKPDLDNFIKMVGDCLEKAGVVRNDSQFVCIRASKCYVDKAKTYIMIEDEPKGETQ